jgi:diacylglycerol kinase (ATP)
MKNQQNIFQRFNCAIEGFIYVMKTQRNMRIHFMIGVLIMLLAIYFSFSGIEILLLCGAITFVLITEMINTSIELTLDLLSDSHHPLTRIAKDVAAGAVFISSVNAIIVGYILFSRHLPFRLEASLTQIKESPWHITFIALILVVAIVVMAKVFLHKGTPLKGGMPSGHTAIAFSMWTIIAMITNNGLITILTLIMAVLIARSRLKQEIHNVWEVVAGGCVGTLVTLLVFQLIRMVI